MTNNKLSNIMSNPSVPGAVEDNTTKGSMAIWQYISDGQKEEMTVKQSSIANFVGVSVRTVRKVLKGFERCNLIKMDSYNGPGRGVKIKNLWVKGWNKIKEKIRRALAHEEEKNYLRESWKRNGKRTEEEQSSTEEAWSETLEVLKGIDKETFIRSKPSVLINKILAAGKNKSSAQLSKSFWSLGTSRDRIMELIRTLLWQKGQNGRSDDKAKEENQNVCNAIGKVFKSRDLSLSYAVKLIMDLLESPKKLFAKNTFGELVREITDWLNISPVKESGKSYFGRSFS